MQVHAGSTVQHGIGQLRISVSAGEGLPDATRQLWKEASGLVMLDGIGATEMFHIFITNRLGDALAAARRLEVGGVHINETSSSRVDVMPYGGSKDSGFGREGPHAAVREMSEERMVTLAA